MFRRIVLVLFSFILFLINCYIVYAVPLEDLVSIDPPNTIDITTTSYLVSNMALEFTNVSEPNLNYPFVIKTVTVESEAIPVYLLDEPGSLSTGVPSASISSSYDAQTIQAILALSKKYSVNQVNTILSITATSHEYISAANVAIWKTISPVTEWKLDTSTVANPNVSAISDWFISESIRAVTSYDGSNGYSLASHIMGVPTVRLDSSMAVANVVNQYNYYGPYKFIVSGGTFSPIQRITPGDYILTTSVGGNPVTSVENEEEFYVRFSQSLSTDLNLNFELFFQTYQMAEYGEAVIILPDTDSYEIQLNISNSEATGNITYSKADADTGVPLSGVTVQILTPSGEIVTQMVTNDSGMATSPDMPVGTYMLKEVATLDGYELQSEPRTVELTTNGQTIALTSLGKKVDGNTTFEVVNASTGGAVTGSSFDLFSSSGIKVNSVITDSFGKCSNVSIDPGQYYLVETASASNYEWLVERIQFSILPNQDNTITISKKPAFSGFEALLLNSNGIKVPNAVILVYNQSSTLITRLTTNESGKVSLAVPQGTYYLRQESTGGVTNKTYPVTVTNISEFAQVTMGEPPPDSVSVSGIISTPEGTPLAGVTVKLVDSDGDEYGRGTTNYAGKYTIEDIPAATPMWFKVIKAPAGFSGDVGTVKIVTGDGRDTEKDLTILRSADSTVVPENNDYIPPDISVLESNPSTLITQPVSGSTAVAEGANTSNNGTVSSTTNSDSNSTSSSGVDDSNTVGTISDSDSDTNSTDTTNQSPSFTTGTENLDGAPQLGTGGNSGGGSGSGDGGGLGTTFQPSPIPPSSNTTGSEGASGNGSDSVVEVEVEAEPTRAPSANTGSGLPKTGQGVNMFEYFIFLVTGIVMLIIFYVKVLRMK
jgi:uncharacterized surface anchored protein